MAEVATASTTSRRPSPQALAAIGATLVAILPVIVVVLTYAGRDYLPVGDYAVIDSRVRDVFSADTPLLGMYSRFGWYHPGPAMFWAVAPFSLLAGGAAWGTLVGAAVVQAGAIVWSARVAWTRGKLLLVLAVLAVQALSYIGIDEFLPLQRPWNPFVAFPLLPLFVLLVWTASLGDIRQIPWVLLVGSFLVQTHVGYAGLVGVGVLWMLFFLIRQRKDPEVAGKWRRPAVVSAVVLAVMWILPFLELLQHRRNGNLLRLFKFFVLGRSSASRLNPNFREPTVGFPLGPEIFAAEFRFLPPWLGGPSLFDPRSPNLAEPVSALYLLVPLLLVIIGLWVSARAGNRAALHSVVLTGLLAVVGILSLTRVRGEATDFVFYWRISLSVLLVIASLGAILTSVPLWKHRAVRIATAVVLALAIAIPSVAIANKVTKGDPELRPPGAVVRSLVAQLDDESKQGSAMLLSENVQVSSGIFDEFNRRGRNVYVSKYFADRYFEGEHAAPPTVDEDWYVVEGPSVSRLAAEPGARELASISPFEPATEAKIRELQAELASQLVAQGRFDLLPQLESDQAPTALAGVPGVDLELAEELVRVRGLTGLDGFRFGVFALPPNQPPPLGFHHPFVVV